MHTLKKILQPPNAPLTVWFGCFVLTLIIPDEFKVSSTIINVIGFGALFTWAWLEIAQGINIVRRILGAVVMLVLVISRI